MLSRETALWRSPPTAGVKPRNMEDTDCRRQDTQQVGQGTSKVTQGSGMQLLSPVHTCARGPNRSRLFPLLLIILR